jgi:hypothetical protein
MAVWRMAFFDLPVRAGADRRFGWLPFGPISPSEQRNPRDAGSLAVRILA